MASRVFRSTALIAVVGAGLLSAACTIPTETAQAYDFGRGVSAQHCGR